MIGESGDTGVVRVLVVDDESLVRSALRVFFDAASGITVVGEASDGAAAIAAVAQLQPDIVLMDVHMRGMDGIEATRALRASHPASKVLALTTFSNESTVVPMLRAGAAGYLLKDTDPDRIIEAVHDVHDGGFVISPHVAALLVDAVLRTPEEAGRRLSDGERLTPRELEVVQRLAEGKSNAEIGAVLFLSEATVKAHLSNVMAKWAVRDRVQVLLKAAQHGIVRLPS